MESLFYIGLTLPYIWLTALFSPHNLLAREDTRGTAGRVAENLLNISGDSTTSWTSFFAI